MTAARQERKPRRAAAAFVAIWSVVGALLAVSQPLGAATSDLVAHNRHTGLAIDGYDPVSYFLGARPKSGRADLELLSGGATWRFANEGNRAAFAANPEVYTPRFGGHDPTAVARGAAAPGHPELWLIEDSRLYLFYSEVTRGMFMRDRAGAIEAADRHWPDVVRTILQ